MVTMEGGNRVLPGLRVGSFNCNGLGNPNKREIVLKWLKEKPEDIILLQEVHTTGDTEDDWMRLWQGDILFNHGRSNSTGVTFLFKRDTNVKICRHQVIVPSRTSLVEIEYESVKYCITQLL